MRREVHPNGGASVLHLYWDEISHLEAADLNRLAKDFLKVRGSLHSLLLELAYRAVLVPVMERMICDI